MTSLITSITVFGPSKKQVMSGRGGAEPTAAKVQQSSWIQLDSIVIAALVFGIELVVVVVNSFPGKGHNKWPTFLTSPGR